VRFVCGGSGFVAAREGVCPSYYQGVMGGRWALPSGNPGVIYLDASGNDIYIHEDETKAREHANAQQTQVLASELLRRVLLPCGVPQQIEQMTGHRSNAPKR